MSDSSINDVPHFFDVTHVQGTGGAGISQSPSNTFAEAEQIEWTWSFGPLSLTLALVGDGLNYEIKLLGIEIAKGRLDAKNPSVTVGVNVGLAKVSLTLSIDFSKKSITISGEACIRKLTGWDCKSFNKSWHF